MKKAIILHLIALTSIAIIVSVLISSFIFAMRTEGQTKKWLTRLTLSSVEIYKTNKDAKYISNMLGNLRVTVIAPNGKVLSDSEANIIKMENHLNRKEVKGAKTSAVYIDIHRSKSLGKNAMYSSIKMQDGTVVRLSYDYAGLLSSIGSLLLAVFIAAVIALIFSLFLAEKFAKKITEPLENLVQKLSLHEFDELEENKANYYEIDKTMESIRYLMKQNIYSQKKLFVEHEKIEMILSDMNEGFILIDNTKKILLCNRRAKEFFDIKNDVKSHNIMTVIRDMKLHNAIDNAVIDNVFSTITIKVNEKLILQVSVSPTSSERNTHGDKAKQVETNITLMFVDITAEKELEIQKQDFFSNAAHELKTPITSIMGFSEMLNQNVITDNNEKKNALISIEKESKRMSELINDILIISTLESKSESEEYESFNFADTLKESITALSSIKASISITFDSQIEDIIVFANQRQLYELSTNLIENAIKYNKTDGHIMVSLKNIDDNAVLTVKDTGIGIPKKYQQRIFERFFRAETGRDKHIEGTGLGLSIVKHIVNLYNGKITLQSKTDEGTTITVSLPIVKTTSI